MVLICFLLAFAIKLNACACGDGGGGGGRGLVAGRNRERVGCGGTLYLYMEWLAGASRSWSVWRVQGGVGVFCYCTSTLLVLVRDSL